LRIAHAHGNRRPRIEEALAAGVDLIEADVRFSRGRLWVRHELKAPFVPLLFNGHVNEFHRRGPYALSLPRSFVRLNVSPIPFDELLDRVGGHAGLLLDLKSGAYSAGGRDRFIETLLTILDTWYHGTVRFCGNWQLLDEVRKRRPHQLLHYSVDDESDWHRLQERQAGGLPARAITIRSRMLDPERGADLRRLGLEFYCWDIESRKEALAAIDRGASGLISHHLKVLRDLAPPRTEAS
jgi:glycerophosphoryl diester phosphodiesterase